MDLDTVRKRLNQKHYKDVKKFVDDVQLTFSNAKTFNAEFSPVHDMAKVVEKHFGLQMATLFPDAKTVLKEVKQPNKKAGPAYKVGDTCMAYQGSNGVRPMLYEAKVLKFEDKRAVQPEQPYWYRVHYKGWAVKWDEWVPEDRVRKCTDNAKQDLKALKEEMNVHFGGEPSLVIVDSSDYAVTDNDMKRLIKLVEKKMESFGMTAAQVAAQCKLTPGTFGLFMKKSLSKQASATQPRPEKVAAMVFKWTESLPEKAPSRAKRARTAPAAQESNEGTVSLTSASPDGGARKSGRTKEVVAKLPKGQQQDNAIQDMVEATSLFPGKHFLHGLGEDLAAFALLKEQCTTPADIKALKKAETQADCRTGMKQLQAALTIDASNKGPAYSLKKAQCEICRYGQAFPHLCLVCERCARAQHIMCLPEPLAKVPEGDWLCHRCLNYRCPCEECGGDGTEVSAMLEAAPPVLNNEIGQQKHQFHLEGYCDFQSGGLTGDQVEKCVRRILEEYNKNMYR